METTSNTPDRPEVIVLVSCVGEKKDSPAPAKDLYESDWFRNARAYAEQRGDRWFIVSALYCLVAPDHVIPPYEKTVTGMKATDRQYWGRETGRRIAIEIKRPTTLVILAGVAYRSAFLEYMHRIARHPVAVEVPMEGLGIGQQKAWLKANVTTVPLLEGFRVYQRYSETEGRWGIIDAVSAELQKRNPDPTSQFVRFDGEESPQEVSRVFLRHEATTANRQASA